MRGSRILVAGALAAALVTIGSAPAAAAGGFCDQATEVYEILNDPSAITEGLDNVIDSYEDFERSGPKKLRRAFKTLREYYEDLAGGEIDISDPDAFEEIGERVAKASAKISKYLSNQCDLDPTQLDE